MKFKTEHNSVCLEKKAKLCNDCNELVMLITTLTLPINKMSSKEKGIRLAHKASCTRTKTITKPSYSLFI